MKQLAALVSAVALGGCTVGPNFAAPHWANPASWFSDRPKEAVVVSEPVARPINPDWWSIFNDPKLTSLERQVASDNLDVQTAGIRIAKSRAQLGITAANQYPFVNGNTSYEREKPSNNGIFGVAASQQSNTANPTQANGAYGNSTGGIIKDEHTGFRRLPVRIRCIVGT